MSKDSLPATVTAGNEVTVYEPPASFEVVDRGSAEVVKFDTVGESFVGRYEFTTHITDEKTGEIYPQLLFTGGDGKPYCIFPGGTLRRAAERMEEGVWYRITYEKAVDVGQPSPMKSYVVERGIA